MAHHARAVLKVSLVWGLTWAAITASVALVVGIVTGHSILESLGMGASAALIFGIFGAFVGAGFGLLIMSGERGRQFSQLSFLRIGLWGGLASAGVWVLFVLLLSLPSNMKLAKEIDYLRVLQATAIIGALGAVSSMAHLRIARIKNDVR